ncbi:unnamed protein product [Calicophoron daubneyi]|uniref:Uncharacterized protein n=1 Tax=Calicophoron daubneyi TaxID=300641 RepID=A0AAV2TWQ1_CALDB
MKFYSVFQLFYLNFSSTGQTHPFALWMNTSSLIAELSKVNAMNGGEFNSHQYWLEVSQIFTSADSSDQSRLLKLFRSLLSENDDLTRASGIELLVPPLLKTLFSQSSVESADILWILSRLIRSCPHVDCPPETVLCLCKSVEVMVRDFQGSFSLLETVIKRANTKHEDIQNPLMEALEFLSQRLLQNEQNVWKILLVASVCIQNLNPVGRLHRSPKWMHPYSKFLLDCFQTSGLIRNRTSFYTVSSLACSLSHFHHGSLDWLRNLCKREKSGKPFAVFLTVVAIELQLLLTETLSPPKKNSSPDLSQSATSNSEIPTSPQAILRNCLLLLRISLPELKQRDEDMTDSSDSYRPLAELADDYTIKGLWLQLLDLASVIKGVLRSLHSSGRNSTRKDALLLRVYLNWLELYYSTHSSDLIASVDEDADRTDELNKLGKKFIQEEYSLFSPLFQTLLSSYLSDKKRFSPTEDGIEAIKNELEDIESCIKSLNVLSNLFHAVFSALRVQLFPESVRPSTVEWLIDGWKFIVHGDPMTVTNTHASAVVNVLELINHSSALAPSSECPNSTVSPFIPTEFLAVVIKDGLPKISSSFPPSLFDVCIETVILLLGMWIWPRNECGDSELENMKPMALGALFRLMLRSSGPRRLHLTCQLDESRYHFNVAEDKICKWDTGFWIDRACLSDV